MLSPLALADAGVRILMHGSNEFSGGVAVGEALAALGRAACHDAACAADRLRRGCFAYWPAAAMAPALEALLGLRRLFGLRSPVNTVARLLDPADAAASIGGVFHPPYIALHLAVAERRGMPRLLVLKGGGGEAERSPGKAVTVHLHRAGMAPQELRLPALVEPAPRATQMSDLPAGDAAGMRAVWRGEGAPEAILATIRGTIATALLATGRCAAAGEADHESQAIWRARKTDRNDLGG